MAYMRDADGNRLDDIQVEQRLDDNEAAIVAKTSVRPNTIALLGDSITWYNGAGEGIYDTPLSIPYHLAQGYFTWANAALGGRLTLVRQAGTPGNTTAQILARITDITELPVLPGYCFVMGGSNDMLTDIPSATSIANLDAIYDALIAEGITVVAAVSPYIWQSPIVNPNRLQAQGETNQWVREQANRAGVIVCDWAAQFANDNGDGTPKTGFTTDGVHPTIVGAARLGKVLADTLRPYVGGSVSLMATNIDPVNVLANGLLTGTAGTLGTGAAGQFATSWTAARTAGAGTLTGAKTTPRSDGVAGAWQSLSIAGGDGTFSMWQDVTPVGFAAGQTWEAEMEFDSLVPTDIRKFTLTIAGLGGGGGAYACNGTAGDLLVYSADVPAGVLRTPPVIINSPATGIRVSVDLVGSSGSVRVSRIRLRRVA